jgi:hypothetical protein
VQNHAIPVLLGDDLDCRLSPVGCRLWTAVTALGRPASQVRFAVYDVQKRLVGEEFGKGDDPRSRGRRWHSIVTLSLAAIDCHFLGICTLIVLPLLSFPARMTPRRPGPTRRRDAGRAVLAAELRDGLRQRALGRGLRQL